MILVKGDTLKDLIWPEAELKHGPKLNSNMSKIKDKLEKLKCLIDRLPNDYDFNTEDTWYVISEDKLTKEKILLYIKSDINDKKVRRKDLKFYNLVYQEITDKCHT